MVTECVSSIVGVEHKNVVWPEKRMNIIQPFIQVSLRVTQDRISPQREKHCRVPIAIPLQVTADKIAGTVRHTQAVIINYVVAGSDFLELLIRP